MQRIRLGNDIQIFWDLDFSGGGSPATLEGADLLLQMTVNGKSITVSDYTVSGTIVSWFFRGKNQSEVGNYDVCIIVNPGGDDQITYDEESIFRLVRHSWEADSDPNEEIVYVRVHSEVGKVIDERYIPATIARSADVSDALSGKVDKVSGKGLSTNDYTDAEKAKLAGIAHGAEVNVNADWNANSGDAFIRNKPDLSAFITNTVDNLTNYYLKSETYTKDEVAALIGAIQQFHYEIYASLPASGANNVLYLIGPTGTGSDRYEEYLYANNAWVKIGDTSIDLSGYPTKEEMQAAIEEAIADLDYVSSDMVKQTAGTSRTDVMSQNAVTVLLNGKEPAIDIDLDEYFPLINSISLDGNAIELGSGEVYIYRSIHPDGEFALDLDILPSISCAFIIFDGDEDKWGESSISDTQIVFNYTGEWGDQVDIELVFVVPNTEREVLLLPLILCAVDDTE